MSYYEIYELNHAALSPFRAAADAARLYFRNPRTRSATRRSAAASPPPPSSSSAPRAATASRSSASTDDRRSAASMCRSKRRSSGSGRSASSSISQQDVGERAGREPEASDRRADVGPLCDAAARHGRRRCCRRTTSTSPTGSTRAWCRCREGTLRPRRLHRLPHLDPASPRAGRACDGGLPAVGAGARRRRADVSGRRSASAGDDDPDGRADRHAPQSDRGQHARRRARPRLVPPQRHHEGAVPASRASCATSIPASCSFPASWR